MDGPCRINWGTINVRNYLGAPPAVYAAGGAKEKLMKNDELMNSTTVEGSSATQSVESNPVSFLLHKKRNRLSAAEKMAKRKAVADDYRAGHPGLAIMLRQGLSKSQFTEILADLFMKDNLTPRAPAYEVVTVSTAIKALSPFAENDSGYVRVEYTDDGATLTQYSKED